MNAFTPPLRHMRLRTAGLQGLGATFGRVRRWNAARQRHERFHRGWDLDAPVGTPRYAIADGVVDYIGTHRDFGLELLLRFSRTGRSQSLPGDTLWAQYTHPFSNTRHNWSGSRCWGYRRSDWEIRECARHRPSPSLRDPDGWDT